MAILAPIDIPAMELYVRRFCARLDSHKMVYTEKKYAPLVSFAELDWIYGGKSRLYLSADCAPIDQLTSAHFGLLQGNADGLTHLFVWFPPLNEFCNSDEVRLVHRAGVTLYAPVVRY